MAVTPIIYSYIFATYLLHISYVENMLLDFKTLYNISTMWQMFSPIAKVMVSFL